MHRHVTVVLLAGVVGAARTQAVTWNTGGLLSCRGDLATFPFGGRAKQASEGPIVPMKPGNAGGGKEPWFGVRLNEPR